MKLYLQNQAVGQIWPTGHTLVTHSPVDQHDDPIRTWAFKILEDLFGILQKDCQSSYIAKKEPQSFPVQRKNSQGSMLNMLGLGFHWVVSNQTPHSQQGKTHVQKQLDTIIKGLVYFAKETWKDASDHLIIYGSNIRMLNILFVDKM